MPENRDGVPAPGRRAAPAEVERYLHDHIPLSRALGARVERFDAEALRLRAPLEPNLNHSATAFGGSLAALAILAGWARVAFDLRAEGSTARVVIQRSHVDFDVPVHDDFAVEVAACDEAAWADFRRTLARRGRARVRVQGRLLAGGAPVARFEARYVALADERGSPPARGLPG